MLHMPCLRRSRVPQFVAMLIGSAVTFLEHTANSHKPLCSTRLAATECFNADAIAVREDLPFTESHAHRRMFW